MITSAVTQERERKEGRKEEGKKKGRRKEEGRKEKERKKVCAYSQITKISGGEIKPPRTKTVV